MKANRREPRIRPGLLTTGVFLVAVLAVGVVVSAGKLKDLYLEQCVIRDMASQVSITSGKMVKADVIAENLGLRPGANLATIAPSISAALVTTVVGLLIAIPGTIAFTRMQASIRNIAADMEGFGDELMGRIACEFQGRGA